MIIITQSSTSKSLADIEGATTSRVVSGEETGVNKDRQNQRLTLETTSATSRALRPYAVLSRYIVSLEESTKRTLSSLSCTLETTLIRDYGLSKLD